MAKLAKLDKPKAQWLAMKSTKYQSSNVIRSFMQQPWLIGSGVVACSATCSVQVGAAGHIEISLPDGIAELKIAWPPLLLYSWIF